MPCCKEKHFVEVENVETLKASAMGFGFDFDWVSGLISKWGDNILSVVVEAVRGGFTKDVVVNIVEKVGPFALELLVNLMNKMKFHHAAAAPGELVVGEEVRLFDASIIETLVQRYLPVLVEKYGDQIVKFVVDWLLKAIAK
jgi:hypothetical protein